MNSAVRVNLVTVRNEVAKFMFSGVCLSAGVAWFWGWCAWSCGVFAPRGLPGPSGVPGPGGLVSQHALRQTPPRERRLLLRTVRILLECILVDHKIKKRC